MTGLLNARAYYEFGAVNRPSGWNTWLEFFISPTDPSEAATPTPRRGSRSANSSKRVYGKAISNYNWNGFYIGANLGGAWASGNESDSVNAATIGASKSGFVGGGQLGYNWQFGHLVVGLEWLFDGTNLKTSGTVGTFAATANTFGISTVTGRFGWALNDWLWYAKAGVAFAGHDLTLANSAALIQEHGFRTSTGWTLGTGVEQALSENWTVKLEYNYLGLTTVNFVATQVALNADQLSLNRQISMLTVGMNYKFPQ
jgi:outer membrane immunogenic protein